MSRFNILVSLVVLVSNAAVHSGSRVPRLADLSILLPPKMTYAVQYRLRGDGGCFKWSCDHHDILYVQSEYNLRNHCSTSVNLKSIAPYSGRKETAVYATDIDTGRVLCCKVYIDNLARIQIFHSSMKLDIDGLATFRVQAFDREENVFSSLVGLRFMWQLMSETNGSAHHLVHVPLKLSPINDCGGLCGDIDGQIKLEDSGEFSDLFVVKGTEIGHERVSVDFLEPMYGHMEDSIVITVTETMSLYPSSPLFVLAGAVVQYFPKILRGNIQLPVDLPSPYFKWSVLNSSVSRVDSALGRAHALNLGLTTVAVEDTRVANLVQLSSLHVVLPDSLHLYILPLSHSSDILEGAAPIPSFSRWYVVGGRQYLLGMRIFSRGPEAQEIYITESDNIQLHDDHSELWDMIPVSDNITTHGLLNSKLVKTTSYGLGKVMATLTYTSGVHEVKEVLKVVQEVMICEPVKFNMEKRSVSGSILLPWIPAIYQEMELKATGGCAMSLCDYKWYSTDMSTVSVSEYGVVQSKKPGKAIITVVSIFDSFNYDEVEIEVSIPSSMIMLQFPTETDVGSSLTAFVTLKASNGDHYSRCDAFNSAVRWNTGSDCFIIVYADEQEVPEFNALWHGPPCAWARIHTFGTGRTMLYASLKKEYYHIDHSLSVFVDLKASALISSYPPLGKQYVSVYAPTGILTNAPFPSKGYRFLVTFSDAFDQSHETLLYDCKVKPSYVGYVYPRDLDGKSYCLFFPFSPEHLERNVGNSEGTRQEISVSISACVREICGSDCSPFIGGFSILEMDLDSLQLDLIRMDNSVLDRLTVVGNTDVEVRWKAQSVLLITPIFRRNDGVAGRVEYEVKALTLGSFKEKVIFSLASNGQVLEIKVNFEPPLTGYEKIEVLLFFFTIIILLLLCHVDRPPRTKPIATQNVAVQFNEHSQQTPQAFIDYVI